MNGFYQCPPCCPYRQQHTQQQSMHMQWGQPMERQQLTPTCNGFIYTVVPGDTMFVISRRYNVSLDALVAANPQITDPAQIFPGQKVCIPTGQPQPPVPQPPACPNGTLHTVVAGENILTIAQRYNLTVQAIMQANPQILNPNFLVPGQQICIPAPPHETPECPGGFIYIVRRGDTLSAIALRYDLTARDILRVNPQITDPNRLYVGQQICIPLPIPAPPACTGTEYIIRKGDTLSIIARRFNLTVNEILQANPQITDPNLIFSGQVICIPVREELQDDVREEVQDEVREERAGREESSEDADD